MGCFAAGRRAGNTKTELALPGSVNSDSDSESAQTVPRPGAARISESDSVLVQGRLRAEFGSESSDHGLKFKVRSLPQSFDSEVINHQCSESG